MKVGVFGGTFNPPHMGHVNAAKAVKAALGLEIIYFIPTGDPPHKRIPEGSATAQQRLDMVSRAAGMIPGAQALDIELKRQGPSYTVDTLVQLKDMHPQDELWLIVGTDMLLSFERWMEPERIVEMAGLAVVPRGVEDMKILKDAVPELIESLGAKVEIINVQPTVVSSTDIRKGKKLPRIPSAVDRYIRKHCLYGLDGSVDNLRRCILKRLSEKRYVHTIGVERMAAKLAKIYGVDVITARKAALIHDITKEFPHKRQLQLCAKHGIMPQNSDDKRNKVIHAETGALVAEHEFKMPQEICDAVRYHSTGRAGMSKLEKIIFVADKIEDGRDYEDVIPVRSLAMRDLDGATAAVLHQILEEQKRRGKEADPRTFEALEDLKAKRKG